MYHAISYSDSRLPRSHGGAYSGKFHNELQSIITNSTSLEEFNELVQGLVERWSIEPALLPELPKAY